MSPPSTDQVIARVRAFAKAMAWSPSGLAVKAGLSPDALRAFARDDWSPTLATLRKLEALIPPDFVAPTADQEAA